MAYTAHAEWFERAFGSNQEAIRALRDRVAAVRDKLKTDRDCEAQSVRKLASLKPPESRCRTRRRERGVVQRHAGQGPIARNFNPLAPS
jgi:hypothetical protein